jgi:hypothetical protein
MILVRSFLAYQNFLIFTELQVLLCSQATNEFLNRRVPYTARFFVVSSNISTLSVFRSPEIFQPQCLRNHVFRNATCLTYQTAAFPSLCEQQNQSAHLLLGLDGHPVRVDTIELDKAL